MQLMKMHRDHAWDSCIQCACLLPKCPLTVSQVRGTLNACHQSVPLHAIYKLSCKVPQTRNTYTIGKVLNLDTSYEFPRGNGYLSCKKVFIMQF